MPDTELPQQRRARFDGLFQAASEQTKSLVQRRDEHLASLQKATRPPLAVGPAPARPVPPAAPKAALPGLLSPMGVAPALAAAAGLPEEKTLLVAEGDSWFDYPGADILSVLEDHYGYHVESVAHMGDTVEQMAFQENQLWALLRRLDRIAARQVAPRAILLSGGGNDIAGDEFAMLLNYCLPGQPCSDVRLNPEIVEGVMRRIEEAYVYILGQVTTLCLERFGRRIPILLHGYAYAVPDGRGFLGGWGPLPGPWLEPGFRAKGYQDPQKCAAAIRALIDDFNGRLARLADHPQFGHVHHVDLRQKLQTFPDETYKKDWGNELHPTAKGFLLVTEAVARTLAGL